MSSAAPRLQMGLLGPFQAAAFFLGEFTQHTNPHKFAQTRRESHDGRTELRL